MPDPNTPPPADEVTPPAVHTPIQATSSDSTVIISDFIFKLVPVLGIFIAIMGISEASWLHKLWVFAGSSAAVPAISAVAALAAWIYDTLRRLRANREKQVLSLLPTTPDTVAIGPANPSAAVQVAVERASALIDANPPVRGPLAP